MDVAPTADRIALVGQDGTTLRAGLFDDGVPPSVFTGERLLRPQYVRSTDLELWTIAGGGAEGQRQTAQRIVGDRVEPVRLPAFEGSMVQAYRISPDGTRMAAVRRTDAGRIEIGLARINRTGPEIVVDGWRELQLEEPTQPRPDEIVDVGWLTPTELVVLATGDGRQTVRPYRLDTYATWVSEIGQPDNWQAVAVATSPRRDKGRAVVLGTNGSWRFEDEYRWPFFVRGLVAVAYAG